MVYPKNDRNICFSKFGAEDSIPRDCPQREEKLNLKGFIQNGCFGNHSHLSEMAFQKPLRQQFRYVQD